MTTIIFDLDGTLIDTTALVIPAYREALRHFPQYPVPAEETMKKTFGMPDSEIWAVLMPDATPAERTTGFNFSDTYIIDGMSGENVLLPHAADVLRELQDRGYTLTVASNCGERYLNAALDTQGIRPFFTHPLCLGSVRGRQKADILTAHFRRFNKQGAVMVGDRKSDVEAAQAHGIRCVGCAFGFGDPQELADASNLIRSLPELLPLFPSSRAD